MSDRLAQPHAVPASVFCVGAHKHIEPLSGAMPARTTTHPYWQVSPHRRAAHAMGPSCPDVHASRTRTPLPFLSGGAGGPSAPSQARSARDGPGCARFARVRGHSHRTAATVPPATSQLLPATQLPPSGPGATSQQHPPSTVQMFVMLCAAASGAPHATPSHSQATAARLGAYETALAPC